MRKMKAFIFLCALIFSCAAPADVLQGHVVGVTDGDTITVLDSDRRQHKIRIAGVDAPEKSQPYGQRAKEAMSALVYGKQVDVEWRKLDRYGRTIGVVTADEKDVGLELLRAGLVWHYKKYQSEQTSASRGIYAATEDQARRERLGLWADKNRIPPWEWRRRK